VTDEFGVEQPKAPLYPGSGYVDWTCLDGYNRNAPWASATQVFAKAYDEITRRIAPDKPMLLGEVASTEDGGDKAVWITDFLRTLPSRFPRIRAFAWFDRGESGAGERHHDWALDSSATATRAFARGIRSAAYAAGRPR
jgi:hypothetical protein